MTKSGRVMRWLLCSLGAVALLAACVADRNRPSEAPVPAHAVVGVHDTHLDADFWIRRERNARRIVLDANAIAAQNSRLQQLDPSVYDVEALPSQLPASQVKEWVVALSERRNEALFDAEGNEVSESRIAELMDSLALENVPGTQPLRHGLIVRRADIRAFPTQFRVFSTRGDTDIDRFQESALFPGTPVAIVHESRDHEWWFIVSALYAAWVEKRHVAEGPTQQVFEYTRRAPYLVVTGATVRTVFTPEQADVSELQLDMGVRVPVLAQWPPNEPVNGQHPYAAHVIELPVRASDGSLKFVPALLPRTADVATDYLPLNRANLLRQGFKFLGERYGWGHSYNARDCSGFVSEVYRSFGVQLPRNSRDQASSPALNRIAFTDADDRERRLAVLRDLQTGDLVYIPGHVMMVIGFDGGMPYVIHDTTGISYRDPRGEVQRVVLNGVSITPLTPLLLGTDQPIVDRITSILRIRPEAGKNPS